MTLHRRLTLFFILIVILPLATAGFVVHRVVVGEMRERAELSLTPALNSVIVLYNDRAESIEDRVRAAVPPAGAGVAFNQSSEQIDAFLARRLSEASGVDFLIAVDPSERPIGFASTTASFAHGFEVPGPDVILAASSGATPGFYRTREISYNLEDGELVGGLIGGFWLDRELLTRASVGDLTLTLVSDGRAVASTTTVDGPITGVIPGDTFETDVGGEALGRARDLSTDLAVVASVPKGPIESRANVVLLSMLGLFALAVAITAVLAFVLARFITQPMQELTEGARAIAQGRFDHEIPVRSRDEVGQLAGVFNEMTAQLRTTITELESSRDHLQRAVRRVGETLRATHDMKEILGSILRTASDAISADAATFWSFTATREELQPAICMGVPAESLQNIAVGDGVVGLVAERGISIRLPDPGGGPRPAHGEPELPVVMALPVFSADRIYGIVALYRADPVRPFSRKEMDTLEFLVEQGGVALENVSLHEEANRLSLTDGLTSIWNRRYMQMQFRQGLATAIRFERPFTVLMLDLDHFKLINDTHGHQRGDAVLIEFAQRVNRTLREVDTFARYGGEEFIALLFETNVEGAEITAEKILESVRAEPFGGPGEVPVELTVSIGVAGYPDHGDSYKDLVEAADRALYQAKKEGRDRAVTASSPQPPTPLRVAT